MNPTPPPHARWPRATAAQVRALRQVTHGLLGGQPAAALQVARALLGAATDVEWGVPAVTDQPRPGDGEWLNLARDGQTLGVEIPTGLARTMAERALGAEPNTAVGGGGPLDERSQGALAYLTARVLATLDGGWRLESIGLESIGDRAAAAAEHSADDFRVRWPVTARVGGVSAHSALWMDAGSLAQLTDRTGADAELVGPIPMTLRALAGRTGLPVDEVRTLQLGDIVVLDRCGLSPGPQGWSGSAQLHIDGSMRTHFECRVQRDTLTITDIDRTEDAPMTDGRTQQTEQMGETLSELAGDAPIELTLEVAHFTLPLEQLASLRRGEILVSGRAVGQAATLRAAGRAIATGELTDVDGEIGLRITALATKK